MASYPTRLRAYRKSTGLSQRELAVLLGLRSQSLISQFESSAKRPGVESLIGCERLFDVPARDIFPGLSGRVDRRLLSGARHLAAASNRAIGARKRDRLSALVTRLSADHQDL